MSSSISRSLSGSFFQVCAADFVVLMRGICGPPRLDFLAVFIIVFVGSFLRVFGDFDADLDGDFDKDLVFLGDIILYYTETYCFYVLNYLFFWY